MPRHPGGGHARRGTSRQRAHKPRLRAPHRRIPPLLMLPQHIYYSTFRPKRKGFSFIIIVFCFGRGENVVFGQSGCVRFCRETVQAAWECTAKVSKGRSQSPLVAPAGAKSPCDKKNQVTQEKHTPKSASRKEVMGKNRKFPYRPFYHENPHLKSPKIPPIPCQARHGASK